MSVLPSLYLSQDRELDWLVALEFGRADVAQPPGCWSGVTEKLGFLHAAPGGRAVGFKGVAFSTFEPELLEVEAVWGEPRFDVPAVGLVNASAGEIMLSARRHFRRSRLVEPAALHGGGERGGDPKRAGHARQHISTDRILLS